MYGFSGVAAPEIEIKIRVDARSVVVVMEDNGQPFDPTQVEEADTVSSLEDRPVGGLGLFFVKNFADRIAYTSTKGRNRLTIEHDLEPA